MNDGFDEKRTQFPSRMKPVTSKGSYTLPTPGFQWQLGTYTSLKNWPLTSFRKVFSSHTLQSRVNFHSPLWWVFSSQQVYFLSAKE